MEAELISQGGSEQEYLTFILDGEEFGIDILCVQEIRGWSPVTEIPNTPHYLRGVINLRGVIVPIVDLRERFSRAPTEYGPTTVVIVLRAVVEAKSVVLGVVVDAVSEVYKLTRGDIRDAPEFGSSVDSCFLKGMATVDEKIIILLDSEKLLDVEELYKATSQAEPAGKETVA